MCTVTFIPQKNGFILSSNRDESPLRSDSVVQTVTIENKKITYPTDKMGGTWLAVSDRGEVLCLLNGAFQKHKHRPPYTMSRGVMLLSFFKYTTIGSFLNEFLFDGIEPFTLIIFSNKKLYEFRWDGMQKHIRNLSVKDHHIYSSCTLYTPEVQNERAEYFQSIISHIDLLDLEKIKTIHRTGGPKDLENAYVMNRNEVVKTVSISHIVVDVNLNRMEINFENLVNGESNKIDL